MLSSSYTNAVMIIAARIEIVRFHSFSHLMFFFSDTVMSTPMITAPRTQDNAYLLTFTRWEADMAVNAPMIAALEIAVNFAGSPPESLCCTLSILLAENVAKTTQPTEPRIMVHTANGRCSEAGCDGLKHYRTDQRQTHPCHRASYGN